MPTENGAEGIKGVWVRPVVGSKLTVAAVGPPSTENARVPDGGAVPGRPATNAEKLSGVPKGTLGPGIELTVTVVGPGVTLIVFEIVPPSV